MAQGERGPRGGAGESTPNGQMMMQHHGVGDQRVNMGNQLAFQHMQMQQDPQQQMLFYKQMAEMRGLLTGPGGQYVGVNGSNSNVPDQAAINAAMMRGQMQWQQQQQAQAQQNARGQQQQARGSAAAEGQHKHAQNQMLPPQVPVHSIPGSRTGQSPSPNLANAQTPSATTAKARKKEAKEPKKVCLNNFIYFFIIYFFYFFEYYDVLTNNSRHGKKDHRYQQHLLLDQKHQLLHQVPLKHLYLLTQYQPPRTPCHHTGGNHK